MGQNKPTAELLAPLRTLKGIGPKRAADFEKAGLQTLEDLLYYFPIRYEDRRNLCSINSVQAEEAVLVGGTVVSAERVKTRKRRFSIFSAAIKDDTGMIRAIWFNQPWLEDKLEEGKKFNFYGKVKFDQSGNIFQLQSPKIEPFNPEGQGIVPVYQKIGDTGGWVIKKIIDQILNTYAITIERTLPVCIQEKYQLYDSTEALIQIHKPDNNVEFQALNTHQSTAHNSLIFEEFFLLQAGLALRTGKNSGQPSGLKLQTSEKIREVLKSILPFHLTDDQKNVLKEIVDDLTSGKQMNRLLHGDVGSGKTIIALLAAAIAIENGYQAALMAPTAILAEQHLATVQKYFSKTTYNVRLLTSALQPARANEIRKEIREGEVDLVIGTHSLIQESIDYPRLGLAIIDEQHRFGVLQRAALQQNTVSHSPHVLSISATPIPRSLLLTLFGDLDVSTIKSLPPGRQPVTTAKRTEQSRARVTRFLEEEMSKGHQIYCVAPVIEESKNDDLQTATDVYNRLRDMFQHRKIGLLHGKIKKDEREKIMQQFVAGKIDILASTTVIEVGVDVPNATVMLIENAERFGLAQLHQLRGRVGRGKAKSYCILMYKPTKNDNAQQRLEVMEKTNNGFVIAEKDLELRGPGDFFGTRQSGVPYLRTGSIIHNQDILTVVRKEAFQFINSDENSLSEEKHRIIELVNKYWKRRFGLVLIG